MDKKILKFGRKSQPFFELSPYHYRTFIIGNRKWRTLIHYWYASCFDDIDNKEMIRNIDTPEHVIIRCKRIGITDVSMIDSKYIINGIVQKISQNNDIKNILAMTGGYTLVYDGFGYLAEDNRYGKLIMKLREKML